MKMTELGLKRSLLFPIYNILSGLVWIVFLLFVRSGVRDSLTEPMLLTLLVPFARILLGGILAAYLPVKKQVDTSWYFCDRLILLVISLFIFIIPVFLILIYNVNFIAPLFSSFIDIYFKIWGGILEFFCNIIPIFLVILIELLYFAVRTKNLKNTAVILLSDSIGWEIINLVGVLAVFLIIY